MNKNKIVTTALVIMTIGLLVGVLIVGYLITRPAEQATSIAPRQTKAQSNTYSKTVVLSNITPTVSSNLTPTINIIPSPSPTEIILARIASPTAVLTTTITQPVVTGTVAPTRTASLPATGTVTNALFIFAAASLLVFFSFLF